MSARPQKLTAPPPSPLSLSNFDKLTDFFYRKTGIKFDVVKRQYVEKRVAERMLAVDAATFQEYFMRLRFDASGGELEALINELTINETYFLREDHQFQSLVDDLLPEITAGKAAGSRVKIWSLPCSTGEEPYSIAIQLLEHWADADRFEIEIHGSDIDSRVLRRARTGIYGTRSLQRLSPLLQRKYFEARVDGQLQIVQALRQSIEFSRVNIVEPLDVDRFRGFDVVFCRNLLIYFDELSQRRAVQAIYDALTPKGFVFLGHSESMSRMSASFRARRFASAIAYQRI